MRDPEPHEIGCSAGIGQRCTCDRIRAERDRDYGEYLKRYEQAWRASSSPHTRTP